MANDSTLSNLNPIANVTDASLFYCVLNGSDFKATGAQLLAYMKAGLVIPVTQAEYNALTPQERSNGSIYLITDGDPIHDLPFPQSVDRTAEVAVYIPNVGLRKVLYSQLETVLQGDTEIGDLKDVTISSLADGDILSYSSTGGADGTGGWVNVVNALSRITIGYSGDLNTLKSPIIVYTASTTTNRPSDVNGIAITFGDGSNAIQLYFPYNRANSSYQRICLSNTWTAWVLM